ncbi:MAG: DUF167 domain-containing protein [Phycisphaeraceae bacterium]|nr:DUF167 domain-containing protein [Phycisphaeraceae bacterium]MCW5761846.1 DUF167 domain-containing protein [Phycisphaeraceae bacterium]
MGWIESSPQGVVVRVKAVPGARADAITGLLGDRLKVRVAAPPEDGRANAAIIALLARALGIRRSALEIAHGQTSPEKTILIRGVEVEQVCAKLGVRAS